MPRCKYCGNRDPDHWCDKCGASICSNCKTEGRLVKEQSGEDPDVGRFCLECAPDRPTVTCRECGKVIYEDEAHYDHGVAFCNEGEAWWWWVGSQD